MRLALEDQGVLLNALATAALSSQMLRNTVSACLGSSSNSSSSDHDHASGGSSYQHMSSLTILVEELDRCHLTYDALLTAEVNTLERDHLLGAIDSSIRNLLLMHPHQHQHASTSYSGSYSYHVYEMSGDEMDALQADCSSRINPLTACLRDLFGWHGEKALSTRLDQEALSVSTSVTSSSLSLSTTPPPPPEGQWRGHVCRGVLLSVLQCVAGSVNDRIMHLLLGCAADTGE